MAARSKQKQSYLMRFLLPLLLTMQLAPMSKACSDGPWYCTSDISDCPDDAENEEVCEFSGDGNKITKIKYKSNLEGIEFSYKPISGGGGT